VAKLFDPRAEFATASPLEGRKQCDLRDTVANGPDFKAQNLFLNPDFGPKAKSTDWVRICATAGFQKRSVHRCRYTVLSHSK